MPEEEKPKLNTLALLYDGINRGASDVHLIAGYVPYFRIQGDLVPAETSLVVTPAILNDVLKGLVSEKKQAEFAEGGDVDAAFSIREKETSRTHRLRLNAGKANYQHGNESSPYITMRIIPDKIPDVTEIGFPPGVWERIVKLESGLVLVTGVTGSGKSTTIASLLEKLNQTSALKIITIEDPIEYIHIRKKSIFARRELGTSVSSFAAGVKYSLRQDPDVILVGEIRDRETAQGALDAAATGHLVFSTLHAGTASEAVVRYNSLFDVAYYANIRNRLASDLAYVLAQQLIPHRKGSGRTLAMEVLNVHDCAAVRNHIREGADRFLISDMQTGHKHGMITMNQRLEQLVKEERITPEEAEIHQYHQQGTQ